MKFPGMRHSLRSDRWCLQTIGSSNTSASSLSWHVGNYNEAMFNETFSEQKSLDAYRLHQLIMLQ